MRIPVLDGRAGKPVNFPYATLGTLFKGRDEFLATLRAQLTKHSAAVIKGRQAIHDMGGVGKTRAAILNPPSTLTGAYRVGKRRWEPHPRATSRRCYRMPRPPRDRRPPA